MEVDHRDEGPVLPRPDWRVAAPRGTPASAARTRGVKGWLTRRVFRLVLAERSMVEAGGIEPQGQNQRSSTEVFLILSVRTTTIL